MFDIALISGCVHCAPRLMHIMESVAATPTAPALARSESARIRPVRRLSRRDSAQEAATNREIIAKRFEEVPFADPENKRAYPLGPHVLTSEHKRLIGRCRLELGRLTTDYLDGKRKLAIAEHDKTELWNKTVSQRADIRRLQLQNTQLTTELIDAHKSLEQMDALFLASRDKRMSRNISETIEEIQHMGVASGHSRQHSAEITRPIVIQRRSSKHGR